MKLLKKTAALFAVVTVLAVCATVNADGYEPVYTVTGAVKGSDGIYLINEGAERVTFENEIKPENFDKNTMDFGGTVTVKVTAFAFDESGNAVPIGQKTSLNGQSGETQASAHVKKGESALLKITVNVNGNAVKIKLSSVTINCKADATPTPTAEEPTPSPTPTPTPAETEKPTPTPTRKPSVIYEPTKDPYNGEGRVTNPPPTMPENVSTDNLATQQPTQVPASTAETLKTKVNNDPAVGIAVFFCILLLLLAADIAVIIWRKKLGFTSLVNGGVSRRKIGEDLCDYPDDDGSQHYGDDSFDNDLDE